MNTKHTPTPWQAQSRALTDNSLVIVRKEWRAGDGHEEVCCIRPNICRCHGFQNDRDIANADIICKAVNAHDDLVGALEQILNDASGRFWNMDTTKDNADVRANQASFHAIAEKARAALTKVKGAQ